ncbi:hypothetical protein C0991_012115 [Blastosporella zonata]|nr:hypothetical protein C0991_012115 [Blastosporella zonata]
MGFLDGISGLAARITPSQRSKPVAGGIGQGHGMVFEDNMIVSKPAIVFHASQIFFNFLAMACFASVAAFQAKWKVGPSGMFLSAFLLAVPVVYEKHNQFVRMARALKEVRVGFILTGTGVVASLLIAFVVTISAWTQAGCKDADNDPHKDLGDDFKKGLDGWCSTKKAGAIFFWLAFGFWAASLVLLVLDWRSGKLTATNAQRDPPFSIPTHQADLEDGIAHDEEDDLEDDYTHVPRPTQPAVASTSYTPSSHSNSTTSRYEREPSSVSENPASPFADENRYAGRPSMDAYGAFSDPAPSGFAQGQPLQEPPRVSRTMQYADPYAAVRASIGSTTHSTPPSYDSYSQFR